MPVPQWGTLATEQGRPTSLLLFENKKTDFSTIALGPGPRPGPRPRPGPWPGTARPGPGTRARDKGRAGPGPGKETINRGKKRYFPQAVLALGVLTVLLRALERYLDPVTLPVSIFRCNSQYLVTPTLKNTQ